MYVPQVVATLALREPIEPEFFPGLVDLAFCYFEQEASIIEGKHPSNFPWKLKHLAWHQHKKTH